MTRLIKPAPGRLVRQPDQGFAPLPQEGTLVNWSPYWERALIEGDVVPADETPEPAKASADKPEKAGSK